jgi:hypothetical protein
VLPWAKKSSKQSRYGTSPQPHPRNPDLTALKSRRNVGAVVPTAEPAQAEQDFVSALSDLLVSDALRARPRLHIRSRPTGRVKSKFVQRGNV